MSAVYLTRVYVVSCACGGLGLNAHRTYADACVFAQAHADLTGRCEHSVRIFADDIPPALVPNR